MIKYDFFDNSRSIHSFSPRLGPSLLSACMACNCCDTDCHYSILDLFWQNEAKLWAKNKRCCSVCIWSSHKSPVQPHSEVGREKYCFSKNFKSRHVGLKSIYTKWPSCRGAVKHKNE